APHRSSGKLSPLRSRNSQPFKLSVEVVHSTPVVLRVQAHAILAVRCQKASLGVLADEVLRWAAVFAVAATGTVPAGHVGDLEDGLPLGAVTLLVLDNRAGKLHQCDGVAHDGVGHHQVALRRERIEPAGAVRVWSGVDDTSEGASLDDGLKPLDVIPHPVQVALGFGPGFPTQVVDLSRKPGLATAQLGQLHAPGDQFVSGAARGVRHAIEPPEAPDGPEAHLVAQLAGVIPIIVQFEGDPTPGDDWDAVAYDRERHCTASPIFTPRSASTTSSGSLITLRRGVSVTGSVWANSVQLVLPQWRRTI